MRIVKVETMITQKDKEILQQIYKNTIEIHFVKSFYHQDFYRILQEVERGGGYLIAY